MSEENTEHRAHTALTVVEQREIGFYGDNVMAVRVEDGTVYVPIRPICDLIGVAWQSQLRRIRDDAVLADEARGITVTVTPGGRPQRQEMICLPLDYLSGWLFGINAKRVKDGIRSKLIQYQRECYRVLADAFLYNRVTARPDDELMASSAPSAEAYRTALALANLAKQQYYLERRMGSAENRLGTAETRIDAIEARLSDPDRLLTTDQARRVADAVQTVAFELGKRSGRNEYGGVYNELYRRFEVPDYKSLPAAKFSECMDWLRTWHGTLTDVDTPF